MSDREPGTQVALWYWRHYAPGFDLFDSEDEAASMAFWMQADGQAACAGIQFPDGRTIPAAGWAALREYEASVLAAEKAEASKPKPPPPRRRKVRVPFSDRRVIEIDADAPPWVGEPA